MNDINEATTSCNIAVIRGNVHSEPHVRDLPAGGIVAQFDLIARIRSDGRESSVTVPIAWHDPGATQLGALVSGVEVVVVGTVRRRFFRIGGATQSRTEVVADVVIPARRRKQVDVAIRGAVDRLLDVA